MSNTFNKKLLKKNLSDSFYVKELDSFQLNLRKTDIWHAENLPIHRDPEIH